MMKYKANKPEETIHTIRNILYKNDLFLIETEWVRDHNLVSSLNLGLVSSPFFSNGKGINEKYASASAYAEFLERFQNLNVFLNPWAMSYVGNFIDPQLVFPDCKTVGYDEYKTFKERFLYFNHTSFQDDLFPKDISYLLCPFYNINEDKVEYLPYQLLMLSIGSNGMCAGNVFEEALIQGLCEICERYVLRQIYYNDNVILPVIPNDYFKKSRQWKYINVLSNKGVEVSIRDCSLGGKFPVIGVFIEKDEKAIFHLGASLNYEIAFERCITEMFQRKQIDNIIDRLQPFIDKDAKKSDIHKEYMRSLRIYEGKFRRSVIEENGLFDENTLFKYDNLISRESLENFISHLKNLNLTLYVRDVSFMGFPSFQVYIPTLSEVIELTENHIQLMFKNIEASKSIFLHLNNASHNQISLLISVIKSMLHDPTIENKRILSLIYDIPLQDNTLLKKIDPKFILAILSYIIGDYTNAYKWLKNSLGSVFIEQDVNNLSYDKNGFVILLKYFEYLIREADLNKVYKILKYENEDLLIDKWFTILKDRKGILKYLYLPNCQNCSDCFLSDNCYQEDVQKIQSMLLTMMQKYDFNQSKFKKYFA